jgi:hypothetical protein
MTMPPYVDSYQNDKVSIHAELLLDKTNYSPFIAVTVIDKSTNNIVESQTFTDYDAYLEWAVTLLTQDAV